MIIEKSVTDSLMHLDNKYVCVCVCVFILYYLL